MGAIGMRKFFTVLGSILYFVLLWIMAIFLFPKDMLLVWASLGAILLLLWTLFFIRIVPSKRQRQYTKILTREYKEIGKQEAELKSKASIIQMTCPSCKVNDNLFRFLNEGVCPACKSGLWTTTLPEAGDEHRLLFSQKENINAFYARINASQLRKIRLKALA